MKGKTRSVTTHSPITEMDESAPSPDGKSGHETRENTRSRAEVHMPPGMGSKKATLYLSRTASLVQGGQHSHPGSRTSTPKGEDSSSKNGGAGTGSKKSSVVSLQREFTFTGYDIMADGR